MREPVGSGHALHGRQSAFYLSPSQTYHSDRELPISPQTVYTLLNTDEHKHDSGNQAEDSERL